MNKSFNNFFSMKRHPSYSISNDGRDDATTKGETSSQSQPASIDDVRLLRIEVTDPKEEVRKILDNTAHQHEELHMWFYTHSCFSPHSSDARPPDS